MDWRGSRQCCLGGWVALLRMTMEGVALLEGVATLDTMKEVALLDTMKEVALLDTMKEIALLEWVATLDTKEQTVSPKQAARAVPHPTSDASHQPEHSQTQRPKETPQTSTTPAERATERLAW